MEKLLDILLVVSLLANVGLFSVYVLPTIWKPKV